MTRRAFSATCGLVAMAALASGPAAAMGGGPAPYPTACVLLKSIDTKALLGDAPRFEVQNDMTSHGMHMTQCSGSDAAGKTSVGLMVRAFDAAPTETPAALRDAFVSEVNAVANPPLTAQNLDIGDAAVWMKDTHQLALWAQHGQVSMILSGLNLDLAQLEPLAREITKAHP